MTASSDSRPILAFIGPTLRLAEAEAALDAIYLHPVAQGDIILAAHAFRPRAMVLIDGQFGERPSVRHKEILWAMAQGITMIGAASMGALRAAELDSFGMIGIGLIYRWYRRFALVPDDAVAVHSGPAELGFLPLTDALVDLQRSFAKLQRRGQISVGERRLLAEAAHVANFRNRTMEAVLTGAALPATRIEALRREVVRQKKADALEALRLAPAITARNAGIEGKESWIATNTFMRDLEASGIDIKLVFSYK